ncbi:uncharacterized protein LOC130510729 isoform X2 [Raphanus sativus]|uniref:Uncharacterized protein LOC130510729 isoform X2 n=1 Tax=Raphanus sativus TaxID=3726 RepID=A0A9W3DHC2_RAPSA|nr:uncharacterized protein LOC130510729 isoform X2 [Raphanus sativus]
MGDTLIQHSVRRRSVVAAGKDSSPKRSLVAAIPRAVHQTIGIAVLLLSSSYVDSEMGSLQGLHQGSADAVSAIIGPHDCRGSHRPIRVKARSPRWYCL